MNSNIESNITNTQQKVSPFGKRSLDVSAVVISAILGLLFGFVVIKDYIGINTFIFAVTAIAGVGYMLHKDDNLDLKNYIFFGGAFLVYASVFFRLKQEVFTFFAFPILIVMLVLTTIYSSKQGAKEGIVTYLYRQFGLFARVDKIFLALSSLSKGTKKKNKKSKQVLLGILISLGLLVIVIPLMISAEAAFAQFVENLVEKIEWDFSVQKFFWKSVAGTVIAILFCGFLYTFTKDKMTGTKDKADSIKKEDNHAIIITVLSIMGFVFLVFAVVQFNSLFISKEAIIENTTFAETARTGYFQLVLLSVINFAMVLFSTKMESGSGRAAKNIIKVLTTYFTLLNFYLLLSSAYKMTLYYDAYGLSVDRLLVYILLAYEVIALIILLIKIYKEDFKFFKTMIYYTVAFWAVISFINIEAWVTQVNVNRYYEMGEIDTEYINNRLSADASKVVKEFYFENYNELTAEQKEDIHMYYFANYGSWINGSFEMDGCLEADYEEMFKPESVLEFNFSKYRKYNDGLEILQHYLGNR